MQAGQSRYKKHYLQHYPATSSIQSGTKRCSFLLPHRCFKVQTKHRYTAWAKCQYRYSLTEPAHHFTGLPLYVIEQAIPFFSQDETEFLRFLKVIFSRTSHLLQVKYRYWHECRESTAYEV